MPVRIAHFATSERKHHDSVPFDAALNTIAQQVMSPMPWVSAYVYAYIAKSSRLLSPKGLVIQDLDMHLVLFLRAELANTGHTWFNLPWSTVDVNGLDYEGVFEIHIRAIKEPFEVKEVSVLFKVGNPNLFTQRYIVGSDDDG